MAVRVTFSQVLRAESSANGCPNLLRTISSKLCHSLYGDDDAVSRPFRGSADYLFTSCHPRLRVFPRCFSFTSGLLRVRASQIRRWWFLYAVTWMGYDA